MSDSRPRDSKLVGDVSHLFTSRAAPTRSADPDGLDEFSPNGDYQAHARPSNHEQPAIHFMARDGSARTFQYMHLDSDSRYVPSTETGARLVFRFMGAVPVEVVISGRNLWPLYNYISLHRMSWAWELPRKQDFEGNDKAVVTSIRFQAPSIEAEEE
jgi:hypothetical protein